MDETKSILENKSRDSVQDAMEENEKPPVLLEPPPPKDIETILFQLTTGPGRDIGNGNQCNSNRRFSERRIIKVE